MRKPVIAGNWKMHMTCAQTRDWMSTFLPLVADTPDDRHLVVAPPFTAISTLADVGAGSRVEISSQNVHWEGHGAYTAEIYLQCFRNMVFDTPSSATTNRENTQRK